MKVNSRLLVTAVFLVISAAIIGSRYLGAFPTIPQPKNLKSNAVMWDVNLSHPYVTRGSDGEVLLNLNVEGQDVESTKRAPVNLVLVIDRSGSMGDVGKIEYAKEAAKRIISGLDKRDRLGIVAYSTYVELLFPIQFLNDKNRAFSVVDSVYPTESTNLSGGLIEGIDQLKTLTAFQGREGYINRVILLSDGLANVGITDIGELSRISSQAAETGIHITTMGLGLHYDENLMTNIAEYGAGNYYFIESPTQLASIFEREFGQMLATVARDSKILLSLAPGVHIQNIYGYTHTIKDGKVQINLGDLFSGEKRNLLIKLNAPTDKIGKQQLATAYFEFTDIWKNNNQVSLHKDLAYEVTEDKNKVAANEDKDVITRGTSVDAAHQMYKATTEYEKGNREDALSYIKSALGRIADLNKSPQKSDATVRQEADLRDVMEEMSVTAPAPASEPGKKLIKESKAKAREQQK